MIFIIIVNITITVLKIIIYKSDVMKVNDLKKEQPLLKNVNRNIKRKHINKKKKINKKLKFVMQKLR